MTGDALRRAKEAACDQSPLAIAITDAGGVVTYVNASFQRLTGYGTGELLGKHIRVLGDPGRNFEQELWEALKGGRVWYSEFENAKRDGQHYCTATTITPITDADGRVTDILVISEDITERKRAEEVLRESEERYRAMVQALPDMMFRMSVDGKYLDYVPAEGMQPYARPEEFLGSYVHEVLPADVASRALEAARKAMETGRTQIVEYELDRDDRTYHYEARVVRCSDEEVLAIVRDVTEERLALEELERSRELFTTVAESTAAGVFIVHVDGEGKYANRALETMSGYTREELLSMNFWDLVHPDFREMMQKRARARLEGEAVPDRYEFRLIRKDGEERWVDFSVGGVITFEGEPAIVGTSLDITERKRNEQALQQAREELEASVEAVSRPASAYGLTFRELTVLKLVAGGKQDAEVADILGISYRTVHTHVTNILRKMKARSRTEASVRAQREGLFK